MRFQDRVWFLIAIAVVAGSMFIQGTIRLPRVTWQRERLRDTSIDELESLLVGRRLTIDVPGLSIHSRLGLINSVELSPEAPSLLVELDLFPATDDSEDRPDALLLSLGLGALQTEWEILGPGTSRLKIRVGDRNEEQLELWRLESKQEFGELWWTFSSEFFSFDDIGRVDGSLSLISTLTASIESDR